MWKNLMKCADLYIKNSSWKDLALIKLCLCSAGIMIGMIVPEDKKKLPFMAAGLLFIATYIPLMAKFIRIAGESKYTKS